MQAKCLLEGDFVVTPDGIGMIEELRINGSTIVKFGASGPMQAYSWRILRQATDQEVMDAGLDGVGHNAYRGDFTVDARRETRTRGAAVPKGWTLDRARPPKVVRLHRNAPGNNPQPGRSGPKDSGA